MMNRTGPSQSCDIQWRGQGQSLSASFASSFVTGRASEAT